MTAFNGQPNIKCYGSRFNGLITLHGNGNGNGPGTGNRGGTIGNNESRFLSLSRTNVNISV